MNNISYKIIQLKSNSDKKSEFFQSICNIESLINNVDFKAEIVPVDNKEKLLNLCSFLKGETLNRTEKQVIEELVNS